MRNVVVPVKKNKYLVFNPLHNAFICFCNDVAYSIMVFVAVNMKCIAHKNMH